MSYKRKPIGQKNKFFKSIEEHIEKNRKEYAISVLFFLAGIIIGVMLINGSNMETQESVSGYIMEFVQSIKNNEYQIDEKKLLIKSIISNLKIAGILWIGGLTIIGIPLIYGTLGYKGICIGYSISAIIASLDKPNGIIFALSSMLLQNIIAIPCILALSVSSMKMYKAIIKNHSRENIKFEVYRHTIFSAFMVIGLLISSVIEILSTNITSNVITNFI